MFPVRVFSAARIHHLCWWASAQGWNINKSRPSIAGGWSSSTPCPDSFREVGTGTIDERGWSLAHCWVLKQQAPVPCGIGFCFFGVPAHGLSRHDPPFVAGCVGGGCDGVVVWELHSGREHLVKQDQ